jgi:hypothetical protein
MKRSLAKGNIVPTSKRNILYIRCSDGRSQRPPDIRDHCVHQIRLPGGILFPELCSNHEGHILKPLIREIMMFAINIMIKLKSPDEIVLASHDDCGAAIDIGLDVDDVKNKHKSLGEKLRKQFPLIKVRVLHEKLSSCEGHPNGHELVDH